MKILIITPTFPPFGGAHTLRMIKMANALKRNGNEVHVLTYAYTRMHPSFDRTLINHVDTEIILHGAPIGLLHKRVYRQNIKIQNTKSKRKIKIGIKYIINLIINDTGKKILQKIVVPDPLIDWYFSVIKKDNSDRLVNNIKPNVIISCSMPSSVHLIGYKLSTKYDIPLVLDYADPWVYFSGYKKTMRFYVERIIEKKILTRARLISFSAEGCRQVYCDKYKLNKNKTITVMSGYEEKLFCESKLLRKKAKIKNENFQILYGGAIQSGVRDISPLLQALGELKDTGIKLLIRTDVTEKIVKKVNKLKLNDIVSVKNYVTFDEHLKEIIMANVIILLGNSSNIQIPSKLFNYIAIGTPIIYLTNIEKEDDVGKIIDESGTGFVVKNKKEEILHVLKRFLFKDMKLVDADINKLKKYSEKEQFAILCKKVKKI